MRISKKEKNNMLKKIHGSKIKGRELKLKLEIAKLKILSLPDLLKVSRAIKTIEKIEVENLYYREADQKEVAFINYLTKGL